MRRLAIPLALVLLAALAAPVAGDSQSATYKGEFTGATFTCGGTLVTAGTPDSVSGDWVLNLSNDRTATVTVHVRYDDAHHLSTGSGQYLPDPILPNTWARGIWTVTFDAAANRLAWAADLSGYYTCPSEAHTYDALLYW